MVSGYEIGRPVKLLYNFYAALHFMYVPLFGLIGAAAGSGRELQQRLSAQRPGMKCVFMSGYTSDVIAHHGVLDAGVLFLQKPFTKAALGAKIGQALAGV